LEETVSAPRWLLPSLGAAVWLALFLGLCLSQWRLVLISADGDAALHWRIGDWMIEHRAVVRAEQFSHTRPDAPLISKEWLSEVGFAAAGNALGWNGAVLVAALLIATTLWLLHRQLRAEGCELLLATGLVLLSALASAHHWLARPHLVTHLLTVVFAWRLRAFDRDRCGAGSLFVALVPLAMVWANLHGAFFTGFVLIGVYALGNLARPGRTTTLTILAVTCLLASLVNPNGWRLHAHVLEFLREPVLAKFANEFRSPDFHSGGMRGFLLVLFVLGLLLIVARPRLRGPEILLILVWGCFALQSVRNVPIFVLVVTPILAEHWQAHLAGARSNRWLQRYRQLSANATGLDRAAGGAALVLVVVGAIVFAQARGAIATDVLPDRFPVAAVEWLRAHPDEVSGEMFNDYGWGGYLMLALPERKVFIDGRNDFYGADLVRQFNRVDDLEPGWEDVLRAYDVGWTILPVAHRLNRLLEVHPGWHEEYRDDVTMIFSRRR
jgi:hypothetical protein